MENEEQDKPEAESQKPDGMSGDEVRSIFGKEAPEKKPSSLFDQTKPADPLGKPEAEAKLPAKPRIERIPLGDIHRKHLLPCGIDIGFNSVKIAQLALLDNKVVVSKMILEEFPRDIFSEPEEKQQKLKQFLTELITKHDLKGTAFSTLATNQVDFRNITLPKMPESEIPGALNWELKSSYGEELDQYSYDYVILGQNQMVQYERTEILLVITKKQAVLEHLDLFKDTALDVRAVEAEPLSLLEGLDYNQRITPSDVILLLDFGSAATRLSIVKNRELRFTRILNINGNSLTQAIKDYCQVSYAEAEEYKRNFGKPQTTQHVSPDQLAQALQIKNAITLLLEKLVSDIDHTFKYYSYQLTKSEVRGYDKVILSGGTSNFHLLSPFLMERLDVAVELDCPLEKIPVSQETAKGFDVEKEAVRFGIALGLALRGLEHQKV